MKALLSFVLVALVTGATLGTIFWQLMAYEQAMGNTREYWIWVWEWIGFTVILTLVLCRQEIRRLIRGGKSDRPAASASAPSTQENTPD